MLTRACAWRLEVPPGTTGVAHRVSHEEVLFVLTGALDVTIDGTPGTARAGDAIVVPTDAAVCVENHADQPASAWVTTSVGFGAVLADGSQIAPPWTR